jgi:hypothetical protein
LGVRHLCVTIYSSLGHFARIISTKTSNPDIYAYNGAVTVPFSGKAANSADEFIESLSTCLRDYDDLVTALQANPDASVSTVVRDRQNSTYGRGAEFGSYDTLRGQAQQKFNEMVVVITDEFTADMFDQLVQSNSIAVRAELAGNSSHVFYIADTATGRQLSNKVTINGSDILQRALVGPGTGYYDFDYQEFLRADR